MANDNIGNSGSSSSNRGGDQSGSGLGETSRDRSQSDVTGDESSKSGGMSGDSSSSSDKSISEPSSGSSSDESDSSGSSSSNR